MKHILDRFCSNNDIDKGLLLINMPTGAGKTYNVLEYIYYNYKNLSESGHKIFFITTLKKNLPIEDLKRKFINDKKEREFYNDVLFIDSNVDCLIENFERIEHKIPNELKEYDLFKNIKEDIKVIKDYERQQRNKKNSKTENDEYQEESFATYSRMAKERLRTESEKKFRENIEKKICFDENGKKRTKSQKKAYVASVLPWVLELYPAVRTDEAKIIFMSLDKFLVRNSTLIEPSYVMANSSHINKAIIFIDEIDACKDTILGNIIDNSLKDKVGMINLFRQIYNGINKDTFTANLLRESEELKKALEDSKCNKKTPEQILKNLKNQALELHTEFALGFFHKLKTAAEKTNNYIFHDIKYHNILSEKDRDILVSLDESEKVNSIVLAERKKERCEEDHKLYALLKRTKGFIDYFAKGISIIAFNYMQRRQKEYSDFSYESALKTVLSECNIEGAYCRYLINIVNNQKRIQMGEIYNDFDSSVFEKGFRYYSILDSDEFDTQSRIDLYDFNDSPEKFILKISDKAKVVGISATAKINSVTGNFYIDYFKDKLGKNYYSLTEEEEKRLEGSFAQSCKYYDKIKISTQEIIVREEIKEDLFIIFEDEEISEKYYQKIVLLTDKSYNQKRYVKILYVMKIFLKNISFNSFLCLLNKKADYKNELNCKFLYESYNELSRIFSPDRKPWFKQLDGDLITFEYKKENINKLLQSGEKVFVVSTYATLGAGQNLQYKIPAIIRDDLIKINDYEYGDSEKDYDGIYLDKPTNIFTNINREDLDEGGFAKFLYDIQFLMASGELSMIEADKRIKSGFTTYYLGGKDFEGIPDCRSVELHYCRFIVQAIGRICRTNNKNREIIICFDSDIKSLLSKRRSTFNEKLMNPEFKYLLNVIEKSDYKDCIETELKNKAEKISTSNHRDISAILKRSAQEKGWSFQQMADWKVRREVVLKAPTIDENSEYKKYSFYIELPIPQNKYWYKQTDDYKDTEISFDYNIGQVVSEKESSLDCLMSFIPLKNYFEEQNYAICFKKNKFILTPVMFNNIYKGALGETVGKFIFEKYILQYNSNGDSKLEEIEDPEKFEKFDFVINKDCYIDFKLWDTDTIRNCNLSFDTIEYKLQACNGKKALIVNIIKEEDNNYDIQQPMENILIVPYLFDPNNQSRPLPMSLFERIRRFIRE